MQTPRRREAASEVDFSDDLNWYAILEGADPYYKTLELIYAYIPVPAWLSIYQLGPYTALAEVGPVLLTLDQPGNWISHWRDSFPGLAGSLIGSRQELPGVASHLRTLISVRVQGGGEAFFRFYDSWIMSAMYDTLEDAERAMIHGPIERWLWLTGNEIKVGKRPGDYLPDCQPPEDGWLTLDSTKQGAIQKGLAAKRTWKETHR